MRHFNLKSGDYKISIPSTIEYKKYMSIIPVVNAWWWLRTPGLGVFGEDGENSTDDAAFVYDDGRINDYGYCVFGGGVAVRPILLFKKDVVDVGRGDTFSALGNTWRVIDYGYAISEDIITMRCFDENSNDWLKSELRAWLIEWAQEREED